MNTNQGSLKQGVTLRSFIIGILFCIFISIAEPFLVLVVSSTGFCADFICAGAIVLIFFISGVLNLVLGSIKRTWALNVQELVVVYSMLIVACAIPTWGLMTNFVSIMAGFRYWDKEAFGFARMLGDHIPQWFIVQDENACKYLFEGLPKGMTIPWAAWIRPVCMWAVYFFTFYFVCICLMTIIRKQWVENERLVFPLNTIPMEIIRDDEKQSLIKPFFRNRLLWIGFGISFFIMAWSGIAHFVPFISPITMVRPINMFRFTTRITLNLSFPILGFTYFVNPDVSASFWIFHLIYRVFYGYSRITGFGLKGVGEPFMDTTHSASFLAMGAMLTLVIYGLYLGRKHIAGVFRKAFTGDASIDDSNEALSYRVAVIGLIGGFIVMLLWLANSGLHILVAAFFLVLTFLCFMGLTRIMAEGGFGFARLQSTPTAFTRLAMPVTATEPGGLAVLSGQWTYGADVRTTVMTSSIHGFQLADSTNTLKKKWFMAIACAVVVSFIVSFMTIIILSYKYGASTFQGGRSWFFSGLPQWAWRVATDRLKNPTEPVVIIGRWLWTAIGAVLMFFLMYMRHRFQWWPIHYLGLPIGDTFVMQNAFFSVFLGWLVKIIILRYGGIKTYRNLKPLFIGLILGQIICASIIAVIAALMGLRTSIPIAIGVG